MNTGRADSPDSHAYLLPAKATETRFTRFMLYSLIKNLADESEKAPLSCGHS